MNAECGWLEVLVALLWATPARADNSFIVALDPQPARRFRRHASSVTGPNLQCGSRAG